MRPAYRYALVFVAAILVAGALLGVRKTTPPEPPEPPRPPVDKRGIPLPLSDPGDNLPQMLDRLEERETERFGAEGAAHRRMLRERMLEERSGVPATPPEPQED